ncbi:glycosyltransferase family 4 protein [Enterobacter sp. E76]|nr:glycosyltransferase family 4 protein [Enterobacter sp. E76]
MKVVNNKIWMNVTTSYNWKRAPVGIVRVETSIAEQLKILYGDKFAFCIWNGNNFVEIPEITKQHKVEEPKQTSSKDVEIKEESNLPLIFPLLPRREALKAIAQGVLSLSPNRLRSTTNKFLYIFKKYLFATLSSKVYRRLINEKRKSNSISKQAVTDIYNNVGDIFNSGDVLISIGLDWDSLFYKKFYNLKNKGVRIITCCYDIIPVLYPQYCVHDVANKFKSYFIDIADGSDLILCISKQSENDLNKMLDSLGAARPKTYVFPLGDSVKKKISDNNISPEIADICSQPFILFVSTIERRKNHEVLYRAYHILASQGKSDLLPKMIFVGMPGWGVNELMKDIELDPITKGLIHNFNHVTDDELSLLYNNSLFCVFPSLYEGWGLPVGEALAAGKVVLCSNRGSLPEVGGGLVKYISPWNPEEWASEIWTLIEHPELLKEMEKRIRGEYKVRTWNQSASSVHLAIERLISSNN